MADDPRESRRAEPLPELWRQGVYAAIAQRRDMREFLSDPIPDDVLARILMAAHQAGSVGFMQPWNFIVIHDEATRRKIHAHVDMHRLKAADGFQGARRDLYLSFKLEGILESPLNLCVTCDPSRFGPAVIGRNTIRETDIYSTCGAVQNLWLAARAEGVGVGWVSILDPKFLQETLQIPTHITPVAYLCMGYVREFPPRPTFETKGWLSRLPLDQVVFSGAFGQSAGDSLTTALKAEMALLAAPHEAKKAKPGAKGLVVVYTGEGKGKTTAALGLMVRALGRGLAVAVVQFIKGRWKTGERLFAESYPSLTFLTMGRGFTWESEDIELDRQAALAAWREAQSLIASGKFFAVILDEITHAIVHGFVDLGEVLDTLRRRPEGLHVILTGRSAPQELIDMADLVSEMRNVKHPFDQGIGAQIGVDF